MTLLKLLIGRRLANREAEGDKMGAFAGIPAMGLDGLGSAAYGPEAALTILVQRFHRTNPMWGFPRSRREL